MVILYSAVETSPAKLTPSVSSSSVLLTLIYRESTVLLELSDLANWWLLRISKLTFQALAPHQGEWPITFLYSSTDAAPQLL